MIYEDWLYIFLEFIADIFLYILADYATKKLHAKWKLCYLIPALVSMIFIAVCRFELSLMGVYIGSLVLLIGFFKEERLPRRICGVIACLSIIGSTIFALTYTGYRVPDYVADFEEGFHNMKEHYVLASHKEIDWDALYAEYLPKFIEVNNRHDKLDNYILWQDFCHEFYDGHVTFSDTEEIEEGALTKIAGNDYGLSLMTLENGDTVAVNVDEHIEDYVVAGFGQDKIKNGTVITSWNGMSIEEAKGTLQHTIMSFPDKENEAFYSALLVAGLGEDSIDITYQNEEGKEVEATLSARGEYSHRLRDTLAILNQGMEGGNLSFHELGDHIVCLRMKEMMYDSQSYANGDHSRMKAEMRQQLEAYKAEGVDKLIIDLRSNSGGSSQFIMTIAELLAPKGEYTHCREAVWDREERKYSIEETTGKYVIGDGMIYEGEGLWDDGEILLLVNAECISAGDHFVMLMSQYENVTVMGFTQSMSSAQGVNSIELESGLLTYSGVPVLDDDGDVFIDTDDSRISDILLDKKIEFDEAAVDSLFQNGEDYLLKQAIQYLKE